MKIEAADYHRNGVSGVGFYVGIIQDDDDTRKLVVSFEDSRDCYTAVLDVDEAAKGNIYMHPAPGRPDTGGNAWRGDKYAHLRGEFERVVSDGREARMKEWLERSPGT